MTSSEQPYHRPALEDRWVGGRTSPGVIRARTRFLYSEPSATAKPSGRSRWAFSRGAKLTQSDWDHTHRSDPTVADAVADAIASFGDDADIEIEIRLAPKQSGQQNT